MDAVLNEILDSPELPRYINELQQYLLQEKVNRNAFYKNMRDDEKVEFINGKVIFHSPVIRKHNQIGMKLIKLMDTFVSVRQLGFVGYEKILIKLTRNDFEPDICFFRKEVADTFSDKTMFFPAPDFIAEILSKSTQKNDRGVKFEDYAFHSVKEYWIINPDNDTIEQYLLDEEKKYELFVKVNEGVIYCKTIAGFNIPVRALFDEKINNDTLKQLI